MYIYIYIHMKFSKSRTKAFRDFFCILGSRFQKLDLRAQLRGQKCRSLATRGQHIRQLTSEISNIIFCIFVCLRLFGRRKHL